MIGTNKVAFNPTSCLLFLSISMNCTNAIIVIGVDPFSFYESNPQTRLDNFIIVPIQMECSAEPACLVSPNFGVGGHDALICDGMGMTEGYCYKYKSKSSSFLHR